MSVCVCDGQAYHPGFIPDSHSVFLGIAHDQDEDKAVPESE